MNIQETVDYHLNSTVFAMKRMYSLLAADSGITNGIGSALSYIGREGVPATKIGPMMGMTPSSLSRLLKTMEDEGFIYRKPDSSDKRVVLIFLTDTGLSLRNKVKDVVIDFTQRLLSKINEEDLQAFIRVNNEIKKQVKEDVEAFQENLKTINSQ